MRSTDPTLWQLRLPCSSFPRPDIGLRESHLIESRRSDGTSECELCGLFCPYYNAANGSFSHIALRRNGRFGGIRKFKRRAKKLREPRLRTDSSNWLEIEFISGLSRFPGLKRNQSLTTVQMLLSMIDQRHRKRSHISSRQLKITAA